MGKEKKEKKAVSNISALFKEMSDGYGSFAHEGIVGDCSGYINTGNYILNACISAKLDGGIPNNKITVLAGDPATGKTFFALNICAQFLASDPTAFVLYWDTEGAITRDLLKVFNIDQKRFFVKLVATVQDFKTNPQTL